MVPSTSSVSGLPVSSPFSSNSSDYSSSLLGFSSSDSSDDEDDGDEDHKNSELTPISDLELNKFLDKPPQALDSPVEDILSLLNSSQDCKSKFKKKIKKRKHKLLRANLLPSSSQSEFSISKSCDSSTNRPRKQSLKAVKSEDTIPSTVSNSEPIPQIPKPEFDTKDIQESVLNIKEEPETLLGENEKDFRDCIRNPSDVDQTNLNLTADLGLDDEEEEDENSEGGDENDDDSLSEYMNITANSPLSLDPSFKFDTDELTSAAPSPASSVNAPSSSAHSTSNLPGGEEDRNCSKDKNCSSNESLVSKIKKISPQKQAKLIEMMNLKRKRLYIHMCKKEIGKVS